MEVDRDPEAPTQNPADESYIQDIDSDGEGVWTNVAEEAVDEAEPYYPPTDPPVLPGGTEGAVVATGFGSSPEDRPFRGDSPPDRDAWIAEQVERVLREDSSTSKLPITVRVVDSVVYLHGPVTDVADAENAETVASQVPGVESVEDHTVVDSGAVEHTPVPEPVPEDEP